MPRAALVALAAVLAAAGCKESLEPSSSAWQATLAPRGGPSVLGGSVAAVSEGVHTRATVAVSNADEDQSFAWEIREGTCSDAAAARVGGRAAYPEFQADSLGAGGAEATVSERLRVSRTYHAVLMEATAARAVVACGALEQRSFSAG
ncbi:MAG TPA: hypothetical protein VF142_07985 [Longimicrobium sp.]